MSELKTNKVSPATGTALAVGDSGDTITVPSGATLDISASTLTPPATMPASSGVNFTSLTAANLTGTLPAISGASLTSLNATNLGSGTVPTARLGSGSASSSVFLSGASTWVAAGGGKIGQVLQATKTDTFSDSSTSFVDITDLSIAITPEATSSKILVVFSVNIGGPSGQRYGTNITRYDAGTTTTTSIAVGDTASNRIRSTTFGMPSASDAAQNQGMQWLDSPNSVAVLTYKIQAVMEGGSVFYINRNLTDSDATSYYRGVSTITVMEVLA